MPIVYVVQQLHSCFVIMTMTFSVDKTTNNIAL